MPPSAPRAFARDPAAVTPVIGTLMILVITILGITGVLLWGAPTIERIQAQNAQLAMIGEMEDLRANTMDLSVPDASRIPTIVLGDGELGVEPGTRIQVAAGHDGSNPACDLHVTGWADASPTTVVVETDGCRTPTDTCTTPMAVGDACLEIHQVVGGNTVRKTVDFDAPTAAAEVVGADFTAGDWLFRLTNGESTALLEVYAEAWLLENDRFTWRIQTNSGELSAFMDSGAVFSQEDGTYFLDKAPPIQEDAFGSGVYVFWIRSLSALDETSVSGQGSYQAFLGLVGNYARVDEPDVRRVRYDFSGELAEAWCQSLLLRNPGLTGGAAYAEDGPDFACTDPTNPESIRSVTYAKPLDDPFPFEFIHARIRISLTV